MQASLLNDGEGISKLTHYGKKVVQSEVITNSHQLTLALEPECVAIYCKNLPNDRIAYADKNIIPENIKSYLILDIGGGTVDITAITKVRSDSVVDLTMVKSDQDSLLTKFKGDSYEVVVPPTGNDFGGNKVNQLFENFLRETVNDDGFEQLLKKGKKNGRLEEYKAMLRMIVHHDFEALKVSFGERESYRPRLPVTSDANPAVHYHADEQQACVVIEDFRLKLPPEFLDFYKEKKIYKQLQKGSGVGIIEGILMISSSKMASFFEPVLQDMAGCVKQSTIEITRKDPFDIAFVAGGFGGCKYVHSFLRTVLDDKLPLLVPADHKLAVAMGAVQYARAPEVIMKRTMDASYGVRVCQKYDKERHTTSHGYFANDGDPYCGNIFKLFVAAGHSVNTTDVFTTVVTPQDDSDTEAKISIYRSSSPTVKYTDDEGVQKIGEIRLNVPNPDNLRVEDRKIEVSMSLSSTEIKVHARALYLPDNPQVTAALDFLTN